MTTLSLTARGQLTLRKEILQHFGIKPGDKLELDLLPDGRGLIRAARPAGNISGYLGLLAGKSNKVASIDELNHAIAAAWAEEGKRP